MRRVVAFIILASAMACLSGQEDGERAAYRIRYRNDACAKVELGLSGGALDGENEFPMTKEGPWWTAAFTSGPEIEFNLFVDDLRYPPAAGKSWRLGKLTEAWIRDGIIYAFDPDAVDGRYGLANVLTINLHTYQESDARACLSAVAELIAKAQVDLVALQECAQSKDAPVVQTRNGVQIRADNAAKLIADELESRWGIPMEWCWDWSHYGFSVYEEGTALMGRKGYALSAASTRYISASSSKASIDSRIALSASFNVPVIGKVSLISTHVSWGTPQVAQLRALKAFAAETTASEAKASMPPAGSIICGDFNMKYRDSGYGVMVNDKTWLDAYALPALWGAKDPTLAADRIDYQFLSAGAALEPILSQRVFLDLGGPEAAFRRVSDHCGVLVSYRAK